MAPSPAVKGNPKEDVNSATLKKTSPIVYSPAKRSHKDFAGKEASESESENSVVATPVAKRLKSTGEESSAAGKGDSFKEESDGESEKESEDTEKEEEHEIDVASSGDEEEIAGAAATSEDDEEEEEGEVLTCVECGGTPCFWIQVGPQVIAEGVNQGWLEIDNASHDFDTSAFDGMSQQELAEQHLEHKHRRHISYFTFNGSWVFGGRGRGNATRLPDCCDRQIHLMYPVPPGFQRVGFIPSEERAVA